MIYWACNGPLFVLILKKSYKNIEIYNSYNVINGRKSVTTRCFLIWYKLYLLHFFMFKYMTHIIWEWITWFCCCICGRFILINMNLFQPSPIGEIRRIILRFGKKWAIWYGPYHIDYILYRLIDIVSLSISYIVVVDLLV